MHARDLCVADLISLDNGRSRLVCLTCSTIYGLYPQCSFRLIICGKCKTVSFFHKVEKVFTIKIYQPRENKMLSLWYLKSPSIELLVNYWYLNTKYKTRTSTRKSIKFLLTLTWLTVIHSESLQLHHLCGVRFLLSIGTHSKGVLGHLELQRIMQLSFNT